MDWPTTVKNNSRLSLSFMQSTPNHTLVPVESLTSSPTSSTGSASVLEWNSNSDGEFLQVSSPSTLTAPQSPALSEPSPVECSLPLAEERPNISPSDQDDPFLSQWESAQEHWTPLFDGLMPPAPIPFDSASPTAIDDSIVIPTDSRGNILDDMAKALEDSFWLDAYAKLGIPADPPKDRGSSGESPHQSNDASQDTSTTSTVVEARSTAPSTAMTTPTITETPATALQTPLASSSLFITPVTIPSEAPGSTFPIKEENEPETISIAEYFQRKALSAEEAAPRAPVTPVEVPPRPESAHSALSYFTQPQSPSQNSQSSFCDGRPIHATRTNGSDGNSETESEADDPPRNSLISTPIPRTDDLLTRSTNHRSPFIGHFQSLFSPRSSGLFGPPSPSSSPSQSEQEIRSPLDPHFPLAPAESPSPYTSRSNSPLPPVPRVHSPYPLDTGRGFRRNVTSSPEFPRLNVDLGSPIVPPYSPEFPRRDDRSPDLLTNYANPQDAGTTRDLPSIRAWLKVRAKQRESAAASSGWQPSPQPLADPAGPNELSDASIPNIPSWLVDSVKAQQASATNGTSTSRSRPPLPPVPKPDVTPQFTLRTEFGRTPEQRTDYYASAFPSGWGASGQACDWAPQQQTWGPWGRSEPAAPAWDTNVRSKFQGPGWGSFVPPASPTVDWPCPSPVSTDDDFSDLHQAWGLRQAGQTPAVDIPYQSKRSLPNPYSSASRPVGDLPKPYYNPYYSSAPNPQYTGSTLPRDQKLYAPPPPPPPPQPQPTWPGPRRLRFAPLPPTPNYRPFYPPPVIPQYQGTPQPPPNSNFNYVYQTPAPVIPPVSASAPPVPPPLDSPSCYPTSKKYWFADANVVFRVENCLYRVHRHFFERHSSHLSKMLLSYLYSPTNHIFLPNVKKVEFERLLSIFYPSDLTKPDITTVTGWTSILELGNKWDMTQVKALAIQKLGPITTAVEKIAIARKHGILDHDWLIPAYTELCARRAPLALDEAEDLDLATVIKIWEVQHAILGMTCNCGDDDKIMELVKDKFGFVDGCAFGAPTW